MKVGHIAIHACQIGLTDTAPLARDRLTGPASEQGERFEAGNLSTPISPLLTHWCEWCNYSPIWIHGSGVIGYYLMLGC